MHPLRQQPILESLILVAGMMSIMLLIQGTNTWIALSNTKQTPPIAKKEASDLTKVAASACAFSTVTLETTMTGDERITNPTKDIKVYDPFETRYQNVKDESKIDKKRIADPKVDTNLPIIGSMFGYRPDKPIFYEVKEMDRSPVDQKWKAYLLGIQTQEGTMIKAPRTGYDIGGGKMGLVTYATSDQIAIHIGRHEYLTGVGNSTAPGYEGKLRNGGYWIYLKGIQVNPDIVTQYNANAATRDRLPALRTGDVFACATGSEVKIAVRDNGPFQDILGDEWWSGVQVKSDYSTLLGGSTTNPNNPAVPAAPGAPAAPVAPAAPAALAVPAANTTTPGPVVLLKTIQDSIELNPKTITKVKTMASEGETQIRKGILLIGDSNTKNENFAAKVGIAFSNKQTTPPKTESVEKYKVANGGWGSNDAYVNVIKILKLSSYKYALVLIGTKDTDTESELNSFENNLSNLTKHLTGVGVVPILQTIAEYRNEGSGVNSRISNAKKVNNSIIKVAVELQVPYVDTTTYIKSTHMTKDGFHYNTKNYGPDFCVESGIEKNCDPPQLDSIDDNPDNPTTGHGIRNVILREAIRKIEEQLETENKSIIVSANGGTNGLKPLTLFGVQAQTASESIISILQSYGSSGYLCYDFGGLSCVPATLSTIEGRAVRVDVTVDKSYPAKPICVSRTNSCNGGIFLDLNL